MPTREKTKRERDRAKSKKKKGEQRGEKKAMEDIRRLLKTVPLLCPVHNVPANNAATGASMNAMPTPMPISPSTNPNQPEPINQKEHKPGTARHRENKENKENRETSRNISVWDGVKYLTSQAYCSYHRPTPTCPPESRGTVCYGCHHRCHRCHCCHCCHRCHWCHCIGHPTHPPVV